MYIDWRKLWAGRHKWLKAAGLGIAVLMAVHSGFIRPMNAFRGISQEKTAGLAAIESNRHWLIPLSESVDTATLAAGIVGGVPGGVGAHSIGAMAYLPTADKLEDHKLVRTSTIELLVKHPAEAAEKVRSLTERV